MCLCCKEIILSTHLENKTTKNSVLGFFFFFVSVYNFLTCHVFTDEYKISKQIFMAGTDGCVV